MNDLWRWLLGVKDLPIDAEGLRPAWERPLPVWGWLLVIGVAIAFAAWSYRGLDAPPRRRTILTALRSVLLIVLIVCVCGPMLELPREDIEPDAVVVLVDRSRSMAVRDGETGPDGRATRESTLNAVLAEAIMDRWPAPAAPWAIVMPSISVPGNMHTPPTSGMRLAMYSRISVTGVIGYPA